MKDGHAVAFGSIHRCRPAAVMDLAAARDVKLIDQSDSYEKMKAINPVTN